MNKIIYYDLFMNSIKNKILDNLITRIRNIYNYDDIKLKEIRYGLESLYLSIFKIIVVIIISIFLKTTKELLLFLLTYGLLRLVGFGAHAKRSIDCWIYSLLFFCIIPFLIKKLVIDKLIIIILSIIMIIFLSIYAPADTEKRPLIHKKKRMIYKILSMIISIIYLVIIIFINNLYISKLLFFSIMMETILVLPITYKLLGVSYSNYKKYIMKGGT